MKSAQVGKVDARALAAAVVVVVLVATYVAWSGGWFSSSTTVAVKPAPAASAPAAPAPAASAPIPAASQVLPPAGTASAASAPKHVVKEKKAAKRVEVATKHERQNDSVSGPIYYASQDNCEAAGRAGLAASYQPTAKHRDFGDARVAGFDKRRLEGDACALIGAQPGKRWVFLKEGTLVYTKDATVKMLGDCQNDVFEVKYLRKEEPAPVAKAPPQAPVVEVPTTVIEEKKVFKVVPYCELPDGTQVKAAVVSGEAVCPDLKYRAPVAVDQPIRVQPRTVQPAAPAPQAPKYVPPVSAPKAEAPCETCVPTPFAQKHREEISPSGMCGIQVVASDGRTLIAKFVIKEFDGRIQITKVDEFRTDEEMKKYLASTGGSLAPKLSPYKAAGVCDADQKVIESNWAEIVKRFNLPNDCKPVTQRRS